MEGKSKKERKKTEKVSEILLLYIEKHWYEGPEGKCSLIDGPIRCKIVHPWRGTSVLTPLTHSQRAVTEKTDFAQPEYLYAYGTHRHSSITPRGTEVVGDLRKTAFAESKNWLFITADRMLVATCQLGHLQSLHKGSWQLHHRPQGHTSWDGKVCISLWIQTWYFDNLIKWVSH